MGSRLRRPLRSSVLRRGHRPIPFREHPRQGGPQLLPVGHGRARFGWLRDVRLDPVDRFPIRLDPAEVGQEVLGHPPHGLGDRRFHAVL